MHLHVAVLPWYNICIILKIDQGQKQKYRGMFETQKSRKKTSSGDIGLNIRTLASPEVGQDQVSGGVSVLVCRYCTFFVLFLTIFIRFQTEMQDNRHIVDAVCMHHFKFIYRSDRYTFHGHLIPSFISTELWPSGYDSGLESWRPCHVGGSNLTVDKLFQNEIKHDIHPRYTL